MKPILFLLATILSIAGWSQNPKSFSLNGAKQVVITSDYPSLTVENGTSQEASVNLTGASIKATDVTSHTEGGVLYIDINFKPDEVKPVKVTYEYEDGTVVTEEGDQMRHWNYQSSPKATITLPSSQNLKVRATYGKVTIAERAGPMDIESTYGGITMKLPSGYDHDLKVQSGYSFVDLSVPKSKGYSVDLSSSYGEILSNLELKVDNKKDGMHELSKTHIQGDIGSGGPLIKVCATYQNIYLRGY
ncbi:MAG: DUF4097 family beta strand repeat protein [Saprospiraceae bacterium]|nr:DUF4097 family beta strand repeat protein [Saprospiraceae bacterium]